MRAPVYFFVFHFYQQSSSDNRVVVIDTIKVARARTSICHRSFHLHSTIVAATKTSHAL
jgi:hypothetical protein